MNQIQLTGIVGLDPEARNVRDLEITSFSVADGVSKFNEKTKKYETTHTNWFKVSCFSQLSKKAMNLKKGDLVQVKGAVKISQYENKEGQNVPTFEVNASEIIKIQNL